MQIPVLIEPVPGAGFRATGGEPFGLSAEGPTPEAALQQLRQLVEGRMVPGAQVVPLEIPAIEHPWLPFAGTLKNDPLVEEWKEAMAAHRREIDANPDVL